MELKTQLTLRKFVELLSCLLLTRREYESFGTRLKNRGARAEQLEQPTEENWKNEINERRFRQSLKSLRAAGPRRRPV